MSELVQRGRRFAGVVELVVGVLGATIAAADGSHQVVVGGSFPTVQAVIVAMSMVLIWFGFKSTVGFDREASA